MAVDAQISWDNYSKQPHIWSQAGTVSAPSCIDGPWSWSWDMLYLDPVQSNSVLSMFSLSLLADIQRPTSTMHSSSRVAAVVMSSRQQCRYNCVSSANEWRVTPRRLTMSARSAPYNTNSTGPRTEPCGTEQTMYTTDEVPPAYCWYLLNCWSYRHCFTSSGTCQSTFSPFRPQNADHPLLPHSFTSILRHLNLLTSEKLRKYLRFSELKKK